MKEEISFIRKVAKRGDDLAITVPRSNRSLFRNKTVKVTVLD